METKICTRCNEKQNIENFYIRRTRNNERKSICKECESKQKAPKIIEIPDLDGEIWMPVNCYGGIYSKIYLISNMQRVKRVQHRKNVSNKITKPHLHPTGYFNVSLTIFGKQKLVAIHRLIAEAFIPNLENKSHVNHINGIKTDNRIENLEWCTVKENIQHAWRTGLAKSKKGEQSNGAKLTEKDVLEIRAIGNTMTQKEIGKLYGINHQAVYKILKRVRWTHI
jgi:hypothetical protein